MPVEPTTRADTKKSKRKVVTILIVTIFLAFASIATAYYYFQIKDLSPQETSASQTCACYFVKATSNVQSCQNADPKMAYEFRTGKIKEDGTCSANCDVTTASPISSASSTPTILSCKINEFNSDYGCIDIALSQEDGKRSANEVDPGRDLGITAKFNLPTTLSNPEDPFYSNFSILVNGVREDFQLAQAKTTGSGVDTTYEVTKTLKDFSENDSLTVQAFGKTVAGTDLTSEACLRTVSVSNPTAPTCSSLDAEVILTSAGRPRVNEVSLITSLVVPSSSLSVKFTVGGSNQTLTTKDIKSIFSNNVLLLDQGFLYNTSNFVDNKSFSILDNENNDIEILAEVYVDGVKINSSSCAGTFEIPQTDTTDRTPTDEIPQDEEEPQDEEDEEPQEEEEEEEEEITGQTSNFIASKVASRSCVERASPNNTIIYTLRARNDDSDTEEIIRVEDKLPLGFTYVSGTTQINGAVVNDSEYIQISTSGSSQQLTFKGGSNWSVGSGSSLTIQFTAQATTSALTGANLNEVVFVPKNTPQSSSSVRSEQSVTVAQNCTSPETGLFDSTASKVILGVAIIVLGIFLYSSQSGLVFSQKFLSLGAVKATRKYGNFLRLKLTNPRKYFEEKIVDRMSKKD